MPVSNGAYVHLECRLCDILPVLVLGPSKQDLIRAIR